MTHVISLHLLKTSLRAILKFRLDHGPCGTATVAPQTLDKMEDTAGVLRARFTPTPGFVPTNSHKTTFLFFLWENHHITAAAAKNNETHHHGKPRKCLKFVERS